MGIEPILTGDVTLYHADCLSVLAALPDGSVDAVVTDPPYGTEVEKDGYGRRQNYGGVGRKIKGDGDLSSFNAMLGAVGRVLTRNAWIAAFCSPKRHGEAAGILDARGFPVVGEVVWDKAAPGLGGGIRYQHETVLLAAKGKPAGRSTLFSVLRSFVDREGRHRRHPNEKPLDVMSALVRYTSRSEEAILDPFAGSGTTAVACLKTGRKCIAIEVDERYIPIIKRRVAEAATPLLEGLHESA